MLLKILVIAAITAISISGCKKHSSEPQLDQEEVKTVAEYEDKAKKEITKENMAQELDKIEKDLQQEINQKQ
jgi:uncharacterized membrane protein (DUF106 family)